MKKWLPFGAGLGLGLVFAVGVFLGATGAIHHQENERVWTLPEHALHATATHGGDNMAIATGPIADGVEGVFFLDFLTGEISCSVLNPRTGGLGGTFKHNVIADLGVERGKKPAFLMVTGRVNFRVLGGGFRPADCVVYVVDANTGNFVVYGLPWNNQASVANVTQIYPMRLMGKGRARSVEIQE